MYYMFFLLIHCVYIYIYIYICMTLYISPLCRGRQSGQGPPAWPGGPRPIIIIILIIIIIIILVIIYCYYYYYCIIIILMILSLSLLFAESLRRRAPRGVACVLGNFAPSEIERVGRQFASLDHCHGYVYIYIYIYIYIYVYTWPRCVSSRWEPLV